MAIAREVAAVTRLGIEVIIMHLFSSCSLVLRLHLCAFDITWLIE